MAKFHKPISAPLPLVSSLLLFLVVLVATTCSRVDTAQSDPLTHLAAPVSALQSRRQSVSRLKSAAAIRLLPSLSSNEKRRKCPPLARNGASGAINVPLVQIKKRSNDRFVCNGLLVSKSMVLTTANCVNEIINTHKYVVGFKSQFDTGNNSTATTTTTTTTTATRWIGIAWACKHPEFERWKGAQHNTGLVVLDEPITDAANHFQCLLERAHKAGPLALGRGAMASIRPQQRAPVLSGLGKPAMGSHELLLLRVESKTHVANEQSIKVDHLLGSSSSSSSGNGKGSFGESLPASALTCRSNEIPLLAGLRSGAANSGGICLIQLDATKVTPATLCNLESAFALITLGSAKGNSIQTHRSLLQQVAGNEASSSNMLALVDVSQESLDSGNCLAPAKNANRLELKLINLSKFWSDGQLQRLINYCSKSR